MQWREIGARITLSILLVNGFPFRAATQEAASAVSQPVDAPTRLFGAELILPANWSVKTQGSFAVIRPPELGAQVFVMRIDGALDASAATVAAWSRVNPSFRDTLASTSSRGATRGWDDSVVFNYDTPASESRLSVAAAFRHGTQWTVFLSQMSLAVLDRRQAELSKLISSIIPQGYVAEDFASRPSHPLDSNRIAELQSFVRSSMEKLRIPGAAMAIITGDQIVLEQGLGIRAQGRPEPVDAHTRFMIASNTKGMTTLLLARLVGEGKIRWNQPATELMPGLKLADAAATARLQVRHLVCACTGLPRADYETFFVDPEAPAQLAFDQLAQLKPTTEFGLTFQYSNTLAAVAGFVAGHVTYPNMEPARAYDRAMRELVWKPLGMNETTLEDPRHVQGNFAAAHADSLDGGIGFAPQGLNATLLPFRPTGSAWSSAHDMALYVRNELFEGRLPGGHQWINRDAMLARRARGVSTGKDAWYGMGIQTELIGGIEVLHHGGSVNGYKSDWLVIPKARIGAVLLTNGDNGRPLVTAFRRKVMELLYDARPEADAYVSAEAKRIDEQLATERKTIQRTLPQDRGPAEHYTHPLLGNITVHRANGATIFDFGSWSTEVGAKADPAAMGGYDYVSIAPSEIDDLAFIPGQDASTRTLTLRDEQHVYVYRETGAP